MAEQIQRVNMGKILRVSWTEEKNEQREND